MGTVAEFVAFSHQVGAPALDAVILGEGNTSLALDEETFLVKASGCNLGSLGPEHAVRMRRAPLMALLHEGAADEATLQGVYREAKVDPDCTARPSVEAIFHAMLLALPGIEAVAHVHATAVNALTCSKHWPEVLAGRFCPDEAVVLGPESVFVDYVDPGVELARRMHENVGRFMQRWGAPPKVVYMQNHGSIALGRSVRDALAVLEMTIKAARIRLATLAAGGVNLFPEATVLHLLGRPDEVYRRARLEEAVSKIGGTARSGTDDAETRR